MRSEYGQQFEDDFLPDNEEAEIEKQVQDEARLALNRRPLDQMLKHNEEMNGTIYKYDLPVDNKPIVFRSLN